MNMTPKEAVISLMKGTAPERSDEIGDLWNKYDPDVKIINVPKKIALNATGERIAFDPRVFDVFWLIGFSGWKVIETYMPSVCLSVRTGQPIGAILKADAGLDEVERLYKERIESARNLITADNIDNAPWPSDIPRPSANRDALDDPQFKAAFDLTLLAVGAFFFHEFNHVILEKDNRRHSDLREEELDCDVWARNFMTAKLAEYAQANGHKYEEVLRKRSMGIALVALILHEITPVWEHGGNKEYFSIATRLNALLKATPLPPNDSFWEFAASLLVGFFRQKHMAIDAPALTAKDLTLYLLDRL